jgi:hypothetical protein
MPVTAFHKRFRDFYELNRQHRSLQLRGETNLDLALLSRRQKALDSLVEIYRQAAQRELLRRVLLDPYFPLSMLRKFKVEGLAGEPEIADFGEESPARMAAEHLLSWAEIYCQIRRDLASLNAVSRLSSMSLTGSPRECLPESTWCEYCGGCCEIRGGSAEFTGGFEPPERWFLYFRGDGCRDQRFCPFLFEYFATGKFFCSIYQVKPKCCWTFGRDECEFLRKDVARERAARF